MIGNTEILNGVNSKKMNAWSMVYDRYFPSLCVYVNKIIKSDNSEDVVEDIVQDIFMSIWNSSKNFKTIAEFTNYLYRAAYNNSLIYMRNTKNRKNILNNVFDERDFVSDEVFAYTVKEELYRQIYEYIETLPEEQKKVITYLIEGYSLEEISLKLNVSINTIKTHKARVFKKLHSRFDSYLNLLIALCKNKDDLFFNSLSSDLSTDVY